MILDFIIIIIYFTCEQPHYDFPTQANLLYFPQSLGTIFARESVNLKLLNKVWNFLRVDKGCIFKTR